MFNHPRGTSSRPRTVVALLVAVGIVFGAAPSPAAAGGGPTKNKCVPSPTQTCEGGRKNG